MKRKTVHNDLVSSEEYHQLYRYCISTQDKEQKKEEKAKEVLEKIAKWIEEGV